MSNQDLIIYEVKGRIATITINRPEKAHAFNVRMLQMMHSRLLEADEDELVKCILIKSTEQRFFSAGYDTFRMPCQLPMWRYYQHFTTLAHVLSLRHSLPVNP